jgi:hypothetical protein
MNVIQGETVEYLGTYAAPLVVKLFYSSEIH